MAAARATNAAQPRYRLCVVTLIAVGACGLLLTGCGGGASSADTSASGSSTRAAPEKDLDRVVSVDGKRGLYVRCTGSGSPTVVMEGGDEDTSDSYAFAVPSIAGVARTCVYDRANLGGSDPAAGPRELSDLVGDLEALLQAAKIPGPYVLVGTSGGGYISAGYAYKHPDEVAGMVFVEVPAPFRNPPRVIVEETDPNNPANIERRDYLQVEKDAWAARKRIGDIPVTIISNEYSTAEIRRLAVPLGGERDAAQRLGPEGLAGSQPAREAEGRPHRSRGRGAGPAARDRRDPRCRKGCPPLAAS